MNDTELNKADKQQKSVTKEISKIILILIIPIAFVAYRYFTAPPAGFCVAQNRFVPAEEFISKALTRHNQANSYLDTSKLGDSNFKVVNCCVVEFENANFLLRIFHIQNGVMVYLAAEQSQRAINLDENRRKYLAGLAYYFDSCGNPISANVKTNGVRPAYVDNGDLPPTLDPNFAKYYVKWPK